MCHICRLDLKCSFNLLFGSHHLFSCLSSLQTIGFVQPKLHAKLHCWPLVLWQFWHRFVALEKLARRLSTGDWNGQKSIFIHIGQGRDFRFTLSIILFRSRHMSTRYALPSSASTKPFWNMNQHWQLSIENDNIANIIQIDKISQYRPNRTDKMDKHWQKSTTLIKLTNIDKNWRYRQHRSIWQ